MTTMADDASASRLAWSWVIESLASSRDVNAAILYDLVKVMPQLSCGLEMNAREMVALRCLEDFFPPPNFGNDGITFHQPKIGFDPSKSCEDALHSMLQEVPCSGLRNPVPDCLKWDVRSFIEHKKVSLPKCTLEQLKDTILQNAQPLAASLKRASGLMVANCSNLRVIPEDGKERAGRSKHSEIGMNVNVTLANASEGSSNPQNGNKFLVEKSSKSPLSSLKRDRTGLSEQSSPLDSPGSTDNGCPFAKKLRQATSCGLPNSEHHSVPIDSTAQSNGASQRTLPVESIGVPSEFMKERIIPQNSNELLVSGGNDSGTVEFSCQHHVPGDADHPQNAVNVGAENDCFEEAKSDEHCMRKMPDDGSDEDHERMTAAENQEFNDHMGWRQENITSHGKESLADATKDISIHCEGEKIRHDKEIDDAMREQDSLGSERCWNQDSSANDFTAKNFCMRCNQGGGVLICSSKECPVSIHESCLHFSATFDDGGKFYCPFCVYSRAISAYNIAKKNASLARKELSLFIGGNGNSWPLNHLSRISADKLSRDKSMENADKIDGEGHVHTDISPKEDIQQPEPSVPCTNVVPIREVNLEKIGTPPHSFKPKKENKRVKEKQLSCWSNEQTDREVDRGHDTVVKSHGNERTVLHQADAETGMRIEVSQTPFLHPSKMWASANGQQNVEEVDHCHDTGESAQANDNPAIAKQADTSVGIGLEVSVQPVHDRSRDAPCESISDPDGFAEDEGDSGTLKSSRYPMIRRPRKDHVPYQAYPQLRRKKVPWSSEEEEMLKEGMGRFAENESGNIPWKIILEFGSSVFYSGRTPGDLKDKWRNMMKAKKSHDNLG